MTSPRLTLTYTGREVTDPWWVRLIQEGIEDDVATLADAADLLDSLYDLDPCNPGPAEPAEDSGRDTFEAMAERVRRVACSYDADGSVEVVVLVLRSRQDADYRLALTGGTLLTTETVRSRIDSTIAIERTDRHTLDWPVLDGFSVSWAGPVFGGDGIIERPVIRLIGNTLDFGAQVEVGTITCSYLSEYDRCTVLIHGEGGKPVTCTARAFFHGLVDELELEAPEPAEPIGSCTRRWTSPEEDDDVTCYRQVTVSTRCQCTDREVGRRVYDEVVPCPEDMELRCPNNDRECMHLLGSVLVQEFVECTGDNEITGRPGMVHALSTPGYYRERCCKEPSFPLPDCPEKTITHRGGLPLVGGAQQYFDIWGDDLRIVPVTPAGGICGNWTIRQEVRSSNCCDGVEPLAWDTSISPEVIAPNSAINIAVTGGGRYPYVWTVSGHGFQFSNGLTRIVTTGRLARLSALPTACGTARVTIEDGCSATAADIRCTAGQWIRRSNNWWPSEEVDKPGLGLFACSSFGAQIVPGYASILQGRWWVGPTSVNPPTVASIVFYRESFIHGLWASSTLSPGPLMVAAPGSEGEVQVVGLLGQGPGYCVLPGGGEVTGVTLYWFPQQMATFEWGC